MDDLVTVGLATWALTWFLSFWYRTEKLREALGIYLVYDNQGEPADRADEGELASWVNCPQCCAILALIVVIVVHWLCPSVTTTWAALGLALLLVRWYEAARPKARWWE